jgi:hypothetical protein
MLQQDPDVLHLNPWSSEEDWAGQRHIGSAICSMLLLGKWMVGWWPDGDSFTGLAGFVAIRMVMVNDIADCA